VEAYRDKQDPPRDDARDELERLAAAGRARREALERSDDAAQRRAAQARSMGERLEASWDDAMRALQARQSASRASLLTRKRVLLSLGVATYLVAYLGRALDESTVAAAGTALGVMVTVWATGLVIGELRLRTRKRRLSELPFPIDRYLDVTSNPYWDSYSGLYSVFLMRCRARVYVVVRFTDAAVAPPKHLFRDLVANASTRFSVVNDVARDVTTSTEDGEQLSDEGRALIDAAAGPALVVRFEARGALSIRERIDRLVRRALSPLHRSHPIAKLSVHPFHPDPGD
jgi:hypothetical protein